MVATAGVASGEAIAGAVVAVVDGAGFRAVEEAEATVEILDCVLPLVYVLTEVEGEVFRLITRSAG